MAFMRSKPKLLLWLILAAQISGCATSVRAAVELPYLRLNSTDCYYVDDFMPLPDNLVLGRSNGLFMRYYTYQSATYKAWENEKIMLSFYSRDNRCWALMEEHSEDADAPKLSWAAMLGLGALAVVGVVGLGYTLIGR